MTVERLEVQRMIEAGAVGGQDRGPGVRPLARLKTGGPTMPR